MISRVNFRWIGIASLVVILGLYALTQCSKAKAPATVTVQLATVRTNDAGDFLVQLSITNQLASDVLLGVRSAIYREQDSWVTNFNIIALLTDLAQPRYTASQVVIRAGTGATVKLSPLSPSKVRIPFQLEFVCFPGRTGMAGVVDKTKDKIERITDGSAGQRLLGESFYVVSPIINAPTAQQTGDQRR